MNRMFKVLSLLTVFGSAQAGLLVVPLHIKAGGAVVWQASKTNKVADISKRVDVKFTPLAIEQLGVANKSLSALRTSLDSTVDVVHQIPFSIDIGEQKVVYRVYSRTSGSKYYEVHILGKESTPTIAGIHELEPNQVINLIAKQKIISLPQQ